MEQVGRYKLRGEIGSGPYTVTCEATDGKQRYAVKVLNEDALPSDPAERAGLVRALAGLKSIEHPSVVKVLDGGEESGSLFIAMEFMDCPTLAQRLQQSPLAEQQAVLFIRQAAQALDKARDLGYCHGDLTARNVFVVSDEKVKIGDFAVKALIEEPPAVTDFQPEGEEEAVPSDDEWVTAEDLLRTKGKKASAPRLDDDFTGLAVIMMQMLGADVSDRAAGTGIADYRQQLLQTAYAQIADGAGGVSVHAAEVVRRLLTPGGFDSPGEVVVELASAMLLGRSFARTRTEPAAGPSPASETAHVRAALDEEMDSTGEGAPLAEGPSPAHEAAVGGGEVSTFFVWRDRRMGTFFVIHDGEALGVGRDPELSDVVLMDPAISRKHCTLSKDGSAITVTDAESSNGTFVNDQRVQTAQLKQGDKLRIGTTRIYTFLPGRET